MRGARLGARPNSSPSQLEPTDADGIGPRQETYDWISWIRAALPERSRK